MMNLRLTETQRKTLQDVVDGAIDAGACKDGLRPEEMRALQSIFMRLIAGGKQKVVDRGSQNPRMQCNECGKWMRLHGTKDGERIQRFAGSCEATGGDHPAGGDVCVDCCPKRCREHLSPFELTPFMIKLLKQRAWSNGRIVLSDDMAFRHAEMAAMREMAQHGFVRSAEEDRLMPGPPRPPGWVITDKGREAVASSLPRPQR